MSPDPTTCGHADDPPSRVQLLADADRPGGWLLLIDRVRQSYIDVDDPAYLDFEYVRAFADVLDLLDDGPVAITHIGGGGLTLARYVAATRPRSTQIVLEPDAEVTDLIRARLGVPGRVRIRPVDGRAGVARLAAGSADVVVLDAFAGGRVPAELTTVEFLTEIARVLRPDGVLLANIADGPASRRAGGGPQPLLYTRRFAATAASVFASVLLRADPAVFKRRRFGNVVLAASTGAFPVAGFAAVTARAMFPQRVLDSEDLTRFVGATAPLTDADPMRSPEPPDALWRIGG